MKKLIVLVTILVFVIIDSEGASALREYQEGMEIPPFTLTDMSGKSYPFHEVAGTKGTLLVFWQTTTRNSEKALLKFQEKYADWRKKGLQILAVNVEKQNITENDLRAIKAVTDKISFPAYLDRGLVLFDKLGVIALPSMILVDDKRIIQKEMSGFPLVGSQLFFEEIGYFLGETRAVAKEVYKPSKKVLLSYQMGLSLEKKRQYEKAAALYEKVVSMDPAYVIPFIRLADIYFNSRRLDAAKTLLAKADKSIASNPVLMMNKGKLSYYEKDLAKAKEMFAESLKSEETPDAYLYTGFISYEEGLFKEAENLFGHALDIGNQSPAILDKIGGFFAAKGEFAKANGYYKRALERILRTDN